VAVTHSQAVAKLAAPDCVRLHPDELGRLGVATDGSVRVTSSRGSLTLPAIGDKAIPAGVAWMSTGPAAELIDVAAVSVVNVEVADG
jgi:anaerobic selenocysteine-containing dehydrogenase